MTKTIELFNGRDLTGWEDHKNPHLWTVVDGMIVGTSEAGKMSNLSTQTQYGDFELTFEYNADAKVIIYHAAFVEVLEKLREQLPKVSLWLQVADDSGNARLPGALDYEAALAAAIPKPLSSAVSRDDLYILYTGGTTGMPRGVMWRHEDVFFAGLQGGSAHGEPVETPEELAEWVKETCRYILQCVLRPVKAKGFVVLPKRWIVERTFAWISRHRRHSKDYERTTESSEAMIYIAMIGLMVKRIQPTIY